MIEINDKYVDDTNFDDTNLDSNKIIKNIKRFKQKYKKN